MSCHLAAFYRRLYLDKIGTKNSVLKTVQLMTCNTVRIWTLVVISFSLIENVSYALYLQIYKCCFHGSDKRVFWACWMSITILFRFNKIDAQWTGWSFNFVERLLNRLRLDKLNPMTRLLKCITLDAAEAKKNLIEMVPWATPWDEGRKARPCSSSILLEILVPMKIENLRY